MPVSCTLPFAVNTIAETEGRQYLAARLAGMSADPDHAVDAMEPTACAQAHDRRMPGSFNSSDPTGIRPRAVLDDILNSVRKGLLRRSAALHVSVSILTELEHRRSQTTVRRALTPLTGEGVAGALLPVVGARSLSGSNATRRLHLTACLLC